MQCWAVVTRDSNVITVFSKEQCKGLQFDFSNSSTVLNCQCLLCHQEFDRGLVSVWFLVHRRAAYLGVRPEVGEEMPPPGTPELS